MCKSTSLTDSVPASLRLTVHSLIQRDSLNVSLSEWHSESQIQALHSHSRHSALEQRTVFSTLQLCVNVCTISSQPQPENTQHIYKQMRKTLYLKKNKTIQKNKYYSELTVSQASRQKSWNGSRLSRRLDRCAIRTRSRGPSLKCRKLETHRFVRVPDELWLLLSLKKKKKNKKAKRKNKHMKMKWSKNTFAIIFSSTNKCVT